MSLCQTQLVQARLEERRPGAAFALKTIKATADQRQDVSLVALGGEGIFVKELEAALLNREIDLAVHSLKDLPLALPEGLCLAAVTEREDARDALVSRAGQPLEGLPPGATIGTSSLRRKSQLLLKRPDLEVVEIRGNVDTRLRKLQEGQYDAIIVAACGLIRLGLEDRITQYLGFDIMLPEPGQGALTIEARQDDREVLELAGGLNDPMARTCVETERAFLGALGGGCRVPIAAYAEIERDALQLEGAVIAADGSQCLRDRITGSINSAATLGRTLADRLIRAGAKDLLTPHVEKKK